MHGGAVEPERVTIESLLIAFQGTGTKATRSFEEAQRLAADLMRKAQAVGSLKELAEAHSDDKFGMEYILVNHGLQADQKRDEFRRDSFVPALGDAAFTIAVGDIRLLPYDAVRSRWGIFLVRRIA